VRGTIISGSTADSSICLRRDVGHISRRPSVARGPVGEGLSAADDPGAGEAERRHARPLRFDARYTCGRARRRRRQREHGHNRRRDTRPGSRPSKGIETGRRLRSRRRSDGPTATTRLTNVHGVPLLLARSARNMYVYRVRSISCLPYNFVSPTAGQWTDFVDIPMDLQRFEICI